MIHVDIISQGPLDIIQILVYAQTRQPTLLQNIEIQHSIMQGHAL